MIKLRRKSGKLIEVEFWLQLGGYYAHKKEDGKKGFIITRLIDFNKDSRHEQFFEWNQEELPTTEDLINLEPSIWHMPLDNNNLINEPSLGLRPIDYKPLEEADFYGYKVYLEQSMNSQEIKDFCQKLIAFSKEDAIKPTRLKLTYKV
jgi:hypothetical protein